jgi:lipoprotein-releasing system permease protein
MRITRRLAKRMSRGSSGKSWARPVVHIATAGVALGIALIIISSGIVTGFQSEIKNLVIGFSSHIQIIPNSTDNEGVLIDNELLEAISEIEGVRSITPLHASAGLLETPTSLKGVSIKGTSDTTMISRSIIEGHLPYTDKEITISAPLANKLELKLGDKVSLYIVVKRETVKPRPVRVTGIYETGLLEYDEKFVFVNSTLLQEVSVRGVQSVIKLEDSRAEGLMFGTDEYGDFPEGRWEPHSPSLAIDTMSTFIWIAGEGAVADTAYLAHTEEGWTVEQGNGSSNLFSNGYEVFIEDFEQLAYIEESIIYTLPFDTSTRLRTHNVMRESPEIFNWLGMLDINVILIIGLMILISIINMVSALLIVILEKRSEVGLLKALGMRDTSVIRMFVSYSSRIIGVGFIAGNILGIGLCYVQTTTGIITLDPAAYYLSEVPIILDFSTILLIEILAFASCVIAMFLPALYSTRTLPSTALRLKQ